MKAAIVRRYGPPETVTIQEMPTPAPKPGEVLVRVAVAGVTTADARIRGNDAPRGFSPLMRLIFGLCGPRNPVLGMEFSGIIAALGPDAQGFATGDRVFGLTGMKFGAHAEYLTIRADGKLFPIPSGLTDTEAAAFFFGGLTAADFLIDKAALNPGERLLINGATGAVGSAAIQIGRSLAANVTAVCSAQSAAQATALGAHQVLDYRAGPLTGQWDAILDVVGTLPYTRARHLLAPGGRLMPVTATLAEQIGAALRPKRGQHRVTGGVIAESNAGMDRLIGLYQAGSYRPLMGQSYPFAEIRTAHALAGSFHKRGNVVVVMDAA